MNINEGSLDSHVGSARFPPFVLGRLMRWVQVLGSQLPHTYSLPADAWLSRHRPLLILLWLHVPFLAVFGLVQGYDLFHVMTEVGVVVVLAVLGAMKRLSRRQRAAAVSMGLVTCSGVLVHLSGGLIEFHFHYFIMVVIITLYQDWVPLLLAVAFVAFQHGIVGTLAPASVYNHPDALAHPLKWALIHATFLLATCAATIVNWRVNENARDDAEGARRRVADILESITDAFFALDREWRFTYVSSAAERLMQRRREDLVGISVSEALPASIYSGVQDALRQAAAEQTTVACQAICKLPDLCLEVRVFPASDGLSVYMRDVTELRRVELELRQAQKLESVGRLAAGVAHEVNTPIQFVGDNTRFVRDSLDQIFAVLHRYQALRDSVVDTTPTTHRTLAEVATVEAEADLPYLEEEIPRAIDQTLEGIERVASIVHALKEFAHPDSREQVPVDLNQALLSTLTVARSELKNVAEVQTDLGPLPSVCCYAGEMNQVFLNVLINAAQAIGDAHGEGLGQITVRTRQDGDWVRIAISDTGCGIPEAIRERIFDPFFTTKDIGRGSGQGLALAHSVIVDKHQGTIDFESDMGKGTTFVISLPIAGISPWTIPALPEATDAGPDRIAA